MKNEQTPRELCSSELALILEELNKLNENLMDFRTESFLNDEDYTYYGILKAVSGALISINGIFNEWWY